MQKLFFTILLLLPLILMAQKPDPAKAAHKDAVDLFLQQYPAAEAVDIGKRKADQKGMHDKSSCGSCPKKKAGSQSTNAAALSSLSDLQVRKKSLIQTLTDLNNTQNPDMVLMQKYKHALVSVQQSIVAYQNAETRKIKTPK